MELKSVITTATNRWEWRILGILVDPDQLKFWNTIYRRHTGSNGGYDRNWIKRNKGLNYFKQNCPICRFAIQTFLRGWVEKNMWKENKLQRGLPSTIKIVGSGVGQRKIYKAQFRRRTFHEPNLIPWIKYTWKVRRLNWAKSLLGLNVKDSTRHSRYRARKLLSKILTTKIEITKTLELIYNNYVM